MVQEYLFIGDAARKTIEEYRPKDVTAEINCINNSDCWTAVYSVPGESKKSAELLSSVNDYIVKKCNPTVLSNGSSAYFNRVLFPYINEFERKLRKLLYLKSAISKGDKFSENIQDLESKDLGAIFELLFTDEDFVKDVRTKVNKKSWQFTKTEIISAVKSIAEETIWCHLIGEDAVPQLKQDFIAVKNYRNDVMHAHNIDTKTFRMIKNLFKKINRQLDAEIGKIIFVAETHPIPENSNYNEDLNKAITEMKFASLLRAFTQELSPEAMKIREIITNLGMSQTTVQQSPEFLEMLETLRHLQAIKMPPEILEIQQNLQRLQEEHDIYRKFFEDMQNTQG